MLKDIYINLCMSFLFCYFAVRTLKKNNMKDFLLKAKQWFLTQKPSTYFYMASALFILVAAIDQLSHPEKHNSLVVFTYLSFLCYIVYNILKTKNK